MMDRRRALMAVQGSEDLHLNDVLTLDGIRNTRSGHNSSSSKWEDLSGNGHDFSQYGSTALSWGDSYIGFNAVAARQLTCNADLQGSVNKLTIEFVMKIDGVGSLYTEGAYFGIVLANIDVMSPQSGCFRFYTYNDTGLSSGYGTTGLVWMGGLTQIRYLAYVFNGSQCHEYEDGVLYNSSSNPRTVTYQSGTKKTIWTIGMPNNHSDIKPNCRIYRLGMSAKAMTATEIAERYQYFKKRFSMP